MIIKHPLYRKNSLTKEPIYSGQYSALVENYHETNFLLFLVEAYLYCRENDYELPEEILSNLDRIFLQLSKAKNKDDGLIALGFDSNRKGGAWQGKAAIDKWNQSQILSLCEDLIGLSGMPKYKVFSYVSEICDTSKGHVKNLYYRNLKK